jgi:GNAT superfamily N-acetyltransferase
LKTILNNVFPKDLHLEIVYPLHMIEISLAQANDAAFFEEIERSSDEAFRAIPELAWIAENEATTDRDDAELIKHGYSWIARDGPDIIGFLIAEPIGPALHIWQMSVCSSHQKKGIGRKLMERAISSAIENNLLEITLTTFRDVAWNEKFYRSCGFETLEDEAFSPFLKEVLSKEVAGGLLRDLRCAMRLPMRPLLGS